MGPAPRRCYYDAPMRHQGAARAIAWILALAIMSPAVHADWLVTQDDSRLETQGEWRVEGRRVIFTLANGTLSAMRLSEVDLKIRPCTFAKPQ